MVATVNAGLLSVSGQGVTASFDASVAVNVPGVAFAGSFLVQVDTTVAAARYVRVANKGTTRWRSSARRCPGRSRSSR